jgi:hypothetical protein
MVERSAGGNQNAGIIGCDSADVFEQSQLQFRVDLWLAVFRTENNVAVKGCE